MHSRIPRLWVPGLALKSQIELVPSLVRPTPFYFPGADQVSLNSNGAIAMSEENSVAKRYTESESVEERTWNRFSCSPESH